MVVDTPLAAALFEGVVPATPAPLHEPLSMPDPAVTAAPEPHLESVIEAPMVGPPVDAVADDLARVDEPGDGAVSSVVREREESRHAAEVERAAGAAAKATELPALYATLRRGLLVKSGTAPLLALAVIGHGDLPASWRRPAAAER